MPELLTMDKDRDGIPIMLVIRLPDNSQWLAGSHLRNIRACSRIKRGTHYLDLPFLDGH